MLVAHPSSALQRLRASAGFTLIELLVVIAMVAILAALAAPSLRQFAANQELSGATSNLVAAAMTARSTAINRNTNVVLEPVSGADWSAGWRIYVEKTAGSGYSALEDELINTTGRLPDSIEVTNVSNAASITYKSDGFLLDFNNTKLLLKATATQRERYIVFDKIGRVYVCGNQGANPCN